MMTTQLINLSETAGPGSQPACHGFHSSLHELRLKQVLCDITILDDHHQVTYAHSVVLASTSEVLKSALTLKQSHAMIRKQGLTIKIGGISVQVWNRLLEFMYTRRINIPMAAYVVKELYDAAKMLGIKTLVTSLKNMVTSLQLDVDLRSTSGAINITLAPTSQSNSVDFASQVSREEIVNSTNYVMSEHTYVTASGESKTLVKRELPKFVVSKKLNDSLESMETEDYQADSSLLEEGEVEWGSVSKIHGRSVRCKYCGKSFDKKHHLVRHVTESCEYLMREDPTEKMDSSKTNIEAETLEVENTDSSQQILPPAEWGLLQAPPPLKKRHRNSGQTERMLTCLDPNCGATFFSYPEMTDHHRKCLLADTSYNVDDYFKIEADGSMVYSDPYFDPERDGAIERPMAKLELFKVMKTGKKLAQPMYSCQTCGQLMPQDRMKTHLAIVHGKRKPFHCRCCDARYGYFDGFRDHFAAQHGKQNTMQCPDCEETFTKKEALRRHQLMVHKRNNQAVHACRGCGKKFKYASHARRHESYHQPLEQRRKFICDLCDKGFLSKQDLFRHRQIHTQEKVYQCSKCHFRSIRKFNVVLHERKHGVVRGNYVCINCGRYFISEHRFKAHLQHTKHEGTHVSYLTLADGEEQMNDDAEKILKKLDDAQASNTLQIAEIANLQDADMIDAKAQTVQLNPDQLEQILAQSAGENNIVIFK